MTSELFLKPELNIETERRCSTKKKLEIDFGKHVEKAREVVNSLIEEAEDTKISIEIKKESRTEREEESEDG